MGKFAGWLWEVFGVYVIFLGWALIIHYLGNKPHGYWSKKANESLWHAIMIFIGAALLTYAAIFTIFYFLWRWKLDRIYNG